MARYGKEHKEATRRRIIEAAGQRLKRDGIDGSGVSVLMADAGLTNGAFYAHFASKEDLVATAVADQLRQQLERYRAQALRPRGSRAVGARVPVDRAPRRPRARLPLRGPARRDRALWRCHQARLHRRGPGTGRPDRLPILAPSDPQSARGQTLSLFALLIGTLQLSRALADRRLADEVLERGIENALALLPGE